MAKEKILSTTRRKKGKQVAVALHKIRAEAQNKPRLLASDEQVAAMDAEDKCYLFDDRVLGASVLRRLMFDSHSLFLALLVVRLANALLIQTSYVPDEYWQSLEVAHKMVFGYGYLTWEWREGLRGYSYPLVFAFFYKVLKIFGLDSRMMLIKIPRLVQGAIAAYGDLQLYKLSSKLSGRSTAQWTLTCQLLSWFTIYCCTRTLSNSTETSLVVAALSYFPWPDYPSKSGDIHKFLLLAAMSVIVRPTSALVWILLCSWHLQRLRGSPMFAKICSVYATVGCCTFFASCIIDRVWYGRWTFVQFNFLLFNVIKGGATIYGIHPWHWYISQGFPAILGTFIFPFTLGAYQAKKKGLFWIILWILAIHSFLPHKEFRFIMPALPLAMHYCGVYFQLLCSPPAIRKIKPLLKNIKSLPPGKPAVMTHSGKDAADGSHDHSKSCDHIGSLDNTEDGTLKLYNKTKTQESVLHCDGRFENKADGGEPPSPLIYDLLNKSVIDVTVDENKLLAYQRDLLHQYNLSKSKIFLVFLALTNLLPALYFSLLHQRGTVTVTKYLHQASLTTMDMNVLFLMPCHSTPYYSYLHQNITMKFLTCEPNLLGVFNYTEEADLFYQDPAGWLKKGYFSAQSVWPTHIVYFDVLHWDIISVLTQGGYKLCEEIFHTHLPEGRVGAYVYVSCR